MRNTRGFTLIEVLIALAIVATTLGGTLALLRDAINQQAYLERRLFADWVAGNVINEYRLAPAGFDDQHRSGVERVLGRSFEWSLTVTAVEAAEAEIDPSPRDRVRVEVRDAESADTLLASRAAELPAGSNPP